MISHPTAAQPSDEVAPTPGQQRALKLWVVLARAHAAVVRQAEEDAALDGLTLTEFGILEALLHKGRLRSGELQDTVLVTSGGTTYLVDRMVARGLVRRADCPEDRRVRYVELTADGEALIRSAFGRHAERLRRAMEGLSAAEQEQATALLKALGRGAAREAAGREP